MSFRRFALVLLVSLVIFPVAAQESTRYEAPDDGFSLPVPAGWTAEQGDYGGILTSSTGAQVLWTAVEAQDADSGSLAALELLVPTFVGAPIAREEFPATGGIWVQQVYVNFLTGKVVVTLSLQSGDLVYVALVAPTDEATITAITPDLVSMLIGFNHKSSIDISGQTPVMLDEQLSELDSYITGALERFNIPGAAVGVVQNGEVIFLQGYGVTDTMTNTPITTDTRFMIGSVSKSMTALLFAQLVDEGVFAWNTPVVEVFPDFALSDPAQTAEITMRDLLSMSSGLPRYDVPMFLEAMTPPQLIADLATYPLVSANGEAYHYNNQIVATGGFIAAVLTGSSLDAAGEGYAELLKSRLFIPAGMNDTTVNFDEALASGQVATSHYYDMVQQVYLPVPLNYERFVVPVAPAGAVWSTIDDMTRYMLLQLGEGTLPDGTSIVSTENLTVTHTGVVEMGSGAQYALGWVDGDRFGQPLLQHDGATAGFTATFAFLPDADLGIVVLANRSGSTLGDAIRDYVIELAFGLEHEADAVHEATAKGIAGFFTALMNQAAVSLDPVTPESVESFLGDYERSVRILFAEDGTLTFSAGLGQAPLYATADSHTFVMGGVLSGIEARFTETDTGIAVSLTSLLANFTETTPPLILNKID